MGWGEGEREREHEGEGEGEGSLNMAVIPLFLSHSSSGVICGG